jgi:hypothetical protein
MSDDVQITIQASSWARLAKERDEWRECAERLAQALWQESQSLEIPSPRHNALVEFERLKEASK